MEDPSKGANRETATPVTPKQQANETILAKTPSSVPGGDVWFLLLSKLWQQPSLELICKLLCCSKTMADLVHCACEGSITLKLKPKHKPPTPAPSRYWQAPADDTKDFDEHSLALDVILFRRWARSYGSLLCVLELHPDFKALMMSQVSDLAAALAYAPQLQKVVLVGIIDERHLQPLVLGLPRGLQECGIIHSSSVVGNLQRSFEKLPPSLEVLWVERHDRPTFTPENTQADCWGFDEMAQVVHGMYMPTREMADPKNREPSGLAVSITHLTALQSLALHKLTSSDRLPNTLTALTLQECYSLQPCTALYSLQQLVLGKVDISANLTADMHSMTALTDLELSCGLPETALTMDVHHPHTGPDIIVRDGTTFAFSDELVLELSECCKSVCVYPMCPSLRKLRLHHTYICDATAAAIAGSAQLTELRLCLSSVPQPQLLLEALQQLPQLQVLELSDLHWPWNAAGSKPTMSQRSDNEQAPHGSVIPWKQAWEANAVPWAASVTHFFDGLGRVTSLRDLTLMGMPFNPHAAPAQQLAGLTQLTALQVLKCGGLGKAWRAALTTKLPGCICQVGRKSLAAAVTSGDR